jgi:lipopolysaccharide export system permease protein
LIINRYFTREILQSLLAVVVVLLLIFLTRYLVLYLSDAAAGKISSKIIFEMLAFRTITSFSVILPFGLYIAVLLAFGRLYKDSEMTALAACGVGPAQVFRSVLIVAFCCSAVVAIFSFWATPWAHEQVYKVRDREQAVTPFASVAAGQFSDIGRGGQVFYVENLSEDRSRLKDIFIQSQQKDGQLDIFSASSGHQYVDPETNARYLVLVEGYRYIGLPGRADFKIQHFKKNAMRLVERDIIPAHRTRWAASTAELVSSNKIVDRAEFQGRFAMPLATIMLAVLGVLLSRTSPRQGRFAKLFIAVLVFITYYNTLGVSQSWVVRGKIPIEIGSWWVHGCLILIMTVIAMKYWGWRPFSQSAGSKMKLVKKESA